MNKETIIDVITVFVVSAVVYKIGMWMEVSKNIAFAVAAFRYSQLEKVKISFNRKRRFGVFFYEVKNVAKRY